MKIEITTAYYVMDNTLRTIADIANEFESNSVDSKEVIKTQKKMTESMSKVGPAYSMDYVVDCGDIHATIEIEDDAILMVFPMAVKIAKALSPLYDMGKAALKMLCNLKDQLKGIEKDFNEKFQKKYGREKTYAVTPIWNEDLHMADVVVVENDGFNNWNLIQAEHCWDIHDTDIIMRVFNAAYQHGQATKNSKSKRYPEIVFENISKEDAIKRAIDLRYSVQKDVDGMKIKEKEEL